jgi:hypothetical protein
MKISMSESTCSATLSKKTTLINVQYIRDVTFFVGLDKYFPINGDEIVK